MQALEEYRKPRDALLILVSDFIRICAPRLEELEEASLPPRYTVPELLDHISVNVRVVIDHLTKAYIPLTYCMITFTRFSRCRSRKFTFLLQVTIPSHLSQAR